MTPSCLMKGFVEGFVEGFEAETYGETFAADYDRWTLDRGIAAGTASAVAFLGDLVPEAGRALELGIGTGRIALPLADTGVEVHGIDASPAMIERLRDKPGGEALPVTVGDFATVDVDGEFDLVYAVFNTFFALVDQDAQVRCVANVAAHLADDGRFVVEAFVPDVARFTDDRHVSVQGMELDAVSLEVATHDPVAQRVTSHKVFLSAEGTRLVPVVIRYAWPAELDLMARLAGLELVGRWQNFRQAPFTAGSRTHVSVYAPA